MTLDSALWTPRRAGRPRRCDSAFLATPAGPGPCVARTGPAGAAQGRGRRTLDDLIVGVWEGLSSHHTVTCPVCSGKMPPRYGSGARPVGGRCKRCALTLG